MNNDHGRRRRAAHTYTSDTSIVRRMAARKEHTAMIPFGIEGAWEARQARESEQLTAPKWTRQALEAMDNVAQADAWAVGRRAERIARANNGSDVYEADVEAAIADLAQQGRLVTK